MRPAHFIEVSLPILHLETGHQLDIAIARIAALTGRTFFTRGDGIVPPLLHDLYLRRILVVDASLLAAVVLRSLARGPTGLFHIVVRNGACHHCDQKKRNHAFLLLSLSLPLPLPS